MSGTQPPAQPPPEAPIAREEEQWPRIDFRNGAQGILTWAELVERQLNRVSLEILRPARQMADELDCRVTTVALGSEPHTAAPELLAHGADRVITIADRRLDNYLTLPYTTALAQVIRVENPEIFLLGATTAGRDLAPRVAMRVRAGVTADCTRLSVGDFVYRRKKVIYYPCLEAHRPSFGESKLATIVGFWTPQMATARPGTFEPLPADPARAQGLESNLIPMEVEWPESDWVVKILEVVRGRGEQVDFSPAKAIVAGGLPCKEDDFGLVRELAAAFIAAGVPADWGATRAAVDNGYAPQPRQIGQTGQTVRPSLYIAVALSGAIQHIAGMKDSAKVVAINTDHRASIFDHADIGVVGDYRQVLPPLIEKVKAGFTFGLA